MLKFKTFGAGSEKLVQYWGTEGIQVLFPYRNCPCIIACISTTITPANDVLSLLYSTLQNVDVITLCIKFLLPL